MTIEQLHQVFLDFPHVSTDTRKIVENCLFFALRGENFNGNAYAQEALQKGAAYAVIDDKGYLTSDKTILVDNVLQTLQDLATFHRNHSNAKVIGLTGSNGKTTTKELIYEVLSKKYKTIATKGNLNNHIGVPLTLLSITEDTEIAVVEMGANHQKEIEFLCSIAQPDFGYITNFGKAHLEGFGGVEGVIKGKSELYEYLMAHNQSVFMNADDPIQLEKLGSYIKKYGFSTEKTDYYRIEFLEADPFVHLKFEGVTVYTQLIGSYNFANCAIAILIGKYFNVPVTDIKEALEAYEPKNNRSQIIEKNGHHIVLDAYNANPTSMKAALESFDKMEGTRKVVILGDMFELGETAAEEHQNIADLADTMSFEEVLLTGKNFYQTTTKSKKYESFETLAAYLNKNPMPESTLLIKGSRGMALERVLELL
ncbi:UDP-N-acetylmuramoyl-tripeptide--D-alanyl-D-alanine ligase [Flavobacteriaceae bacterium TP-CH-4]|uniref:UDP-N-acetylmuramoyl-tripeptide--D-alanyl-D-alanine ligase n=1 Tax=Pelagihabitans pacificus TaxID=2696054 RepID=A0A967AV61_9FLAO|nr:UDP-N-acetylmuramoyl-tripeptide--D-alanyl-D-alanine ligase [Pelagihabitans pacificus]NHF60981.1 UDP-N-acetylmuramoyl-tripeptide--D-alanyl-D-alanine ligase [Pelagihabitans pacificus]